MKKLSIAFICLCITTFILCAVNVYAFTYTAEDDAIPELAGDSNNLVAQDNETSSYTFDSLSFLKIESNNFSALQIYNGEVYIRDGFNYKVYHLDPKTGLLTLLNSAKAVKMLYPDEIRQFLEKIKNKSSELINLVLNLMVVIVWLPTAYICIG
ncbi:MAG: hypothetical protein PHD29_08730 [bacterium]|nr:hypothetical protein [bacterium]MDD5354247.1 hypothetical protein [bacterium]MDD5756066.1 hypothetical protein [bacterium]